MSMTALFNDPIRLADVTPEILDKVVASSYRRGRVSYNEHYLDVLTARGCSRSITAFKRADGTVVWKVWSPRNGWAEANMTKEFQKVLMPEKAKKDEQRKQERKAKNIADGSVHVGSVFASAGGYDATIWHFYQVTSVSASGMTVTTRELAQQTRDSAVGPCCWQCRPVKDAFRGTPIKHRVNYLYGDPSLHISSWESAFLMKDEEVDKWQEADNYH